MTITVGALARSLTVLAFLAGCGSAPTTSPKTAASNADDGEKKAAEDNSKKEKTAAATDAAEPAEDNDPRAGDGLRKASRPPAELITGPNLVYVFNFKESEVGIAAKERCEELGGDSPRAVAQCLEKARGKVPVELIRFIKEPSGEHWWVTYNRYKGNLLKWHRVQFQPGKESDERITLNLLGKDKGIAPMARVPRHLEIELPNDYSIVVKDPEFGDMLYDAKIGTMEVD
jgi:hypothetical protein